MRQRRTDGAIAGDVVVASPDDLPRPPERPDPEMCCGRGCCPCIFDYYDDALARWQALVRERGFDPDALFPSLKG